MKKIIFRIDDIGSSSKKYEVYSKFFLGNFLFLKYLPPFASWGPYQELPAQIWEKIFDLLEKFKAKMTVAVTASWVEEDGTLVPFPKKFNRQAKILKKGVDRNLIEIANHGLTHCVLGKHKPRPFSPNRKFHREFWQWVPKETHYKNLETSQKILKDYFGPILIFVPPGNVWTQDTEIAAFKFGIRFLCGRSDLVKTGQKSNGLIYISDSDSFSFHDRDIAKRGVSALEEKLGEFKKRNFEIITVSDFAKEVA